MKYVKTKDGRILKVECIKEFNGKLYGFDEQKYSYRYENGVEVLKQTDNLEELFDEYILENKDHTYQSLLVKADHYDKRSFSDSFTEDVKNGWLSYCDEYLQNGCKIYGAIIIRGMRDEPILKPVAQMNEKGEWVLL